MFVVIADLPGGIVAVDDVAGFVVEVGQANVRIAHFGQQAGEVVAEGNFPILGMFGFERVAGAVEGDAEQLGDAVVAETECAFIHAGEAFEFGVTDKQAGVVAEFDGGGEHGGEGVAAFFP